MSHKLCVNQIYTLAAPYLMIQIFKCKSSHNRCFQDICLIFRLDIPYLSLFYRLISHIIPSNLNKRTLIKRSEANLNTSMRICSTFHVERSHSNIYLLMQTWQINSIYSKEKLLLLDYLSLIGTIK